MKISIHQANFFPYQGFFQKIEQVDLFVIMTHCQFEKNNYQNRFNIGDKWYTMSVNSGLEPIQNKKYVNHKKDWKSISSQLPICKEFDDCISDNLAETNISIIKRACKLLGIKTKIAYDYHTSLSGTARLVDICKKFKADTYLSGISGKNYLNLQLFDRAEINVEFQENIINKPLVNLLSDAGI